MCPMDITTELYGSQDVHQENRSEALQMQQHVCGGNGCTQVPFSHVIPNAAGDNGFHLPLCVVFSNTVYE